MALENASVFLRLSKSEKGLTLSGDDVDGFYTVSKKQVIDLIKGEREYVNMSRVVDEEEDGDDGGEVEDLDEIEETPSTEQ